MQSVNSVLNVDITARIFSAGSSWALAGSVVLLLRSVPNWLMSADRELPSSLACQRDVRGLLLRSVPYWLMSADRELPSSLACQRDVRGLLLRSVPYWLMPADRELPSSLACQRDVRGLSASLGECRPVRDRCKTEPSRVACGVPSFVRNTSLSCAISAAKVFNTCQISSSFLPIMKMLFAFAGPRQCVSPSKNSSMVNTPSPSSSKSNNIWTSEGLKFNKLKCWATSGLMKAAINSLKQRRPSLSTSMEANSR
mmetsp:Transcript_41085/g.132149  ORF Transcript_41085/g.132149 Transcript_41085/m.132149 type:complete len:254 (+) Transcript_41085:169-930(+)